MNAESSSHTRVEGTVLETVPNNLFRVRLTDGRAVLAHLSEDARISTVRLVPGDRVVVEPTLFDPSRARIVGRPQGRKHESIGLG